MNNESGMLKVEESNISGILEKFSKQSNFGEHNILIYPDRYTLRELYSHACKMALENNEVVVVLADYETRNDVLTYLKELDIDINRYEKKERSLLIIDSPNEYFGSATDFLFYMRAMNRNASRRNKRGISILLDAGFHFYRHRNNNQEQRGIDTLIEYEKCLPTQSDLDIKLLCLYHIKDFEVVEQANQKEHLLKLHFRRYKVITDYNSDD